MNYRTWVRGLRKYWWVVLICTVVGAGVGTIITVATTPQYASSVTFFVRTPTDQLGGAYQGDQFAQKRVNSYAQLAKSGRLGQMIADDTQIDLSADQISSRITARGDLNTVLLNLTVTDTDPERSLEIAESASVQMVDLVSQIETAPGATDPGVSLEVTSAARLEASPVSPDAVLNIGLATLIGLIVGTALAGLREMTDTSVRTPEDVEDATGSGVLAVIPFDAEAGESPLIVDTHSRSIRAEAYRQLRTNLAFVDVDRPIRRVLLTSSVAEEGKSSTAVNLAVAFAESGERTLLIEADLRRPRVATYLGLESAVGLSDVLANRAELDDVLQPWGRGGLTVLPCGSIPPNPSELLASSAMSKLLDEIDKTFSMVVIDTAPLLPVTDAAVLSTKVDGAVVVVRHGRTTRQQLHTSAESLRAVDARVLGTILNRVPISGADSYSYYGYGSYQPHENTSSHSAGDAGGEVSSGKHRPDGGESEVATSQVAVRSGK
ncbi:polysaccharide biosynthesis tyrosine autokinase [Nakamurella leprariae]|uniref:non-specific protein-tyrosine kinase n=1 Tax=Nakamurella leprariae TaxID=2803911 RepID=A0A939C0D8_9ACTN|nr:polysaccharide biosynthesis tyrosine autokinase [Nakamurella leprariae]MBM9469120.1 polysaccharide biosynthesis tyrosine autokinase [Nakamurella leprariae]